MLPQNSGRSTSPDTSGSVNHSFGRVPCQRNASARERLPIHPLLIALFPILTLYAHNISEVPVQEIWIPLGWSLLGSVVVWILIFTLTRQIRKAAIAASAITLVFFSYGHIENLLPPEFRFATAPLCLIGLVALLFAIYRNKSRLNQATIVLNFASLALLAPSCFTIGARLIAKASQTEQAAANLRKEISQQRIVQETGGNAPIFTHPPGIALAEAAAYRPDIYYIILDAYGRSDSLKAFYGYDNTPFLRALQKRGFYIASHSRANYDQTGLCLPTSLNMNYFSDLLPTRGSADNLFESQRKMIDENAVADYLRALGYHYVYIWTGTEVTRVETADLELDDNTVSPPSSFAGQVFSLSALDMLPPTQPAILGTAADYEKHRAFIQSGFTNLDSVVNLPYSKFVFAHIGAPHPPFVFGAQGEAVDPHYPYNDSDGSELLHRITREQYKRGYIAQLKYLNQRVLEAVDAIQRQSRRPPLIILQGDHGSRMNLDWTSQAKTDLREPFSILNAYYVPPRVRRHLYSTITPVNSFRIVLSSLFGANYPVLPDRSYFSTPDNPLHFADVTDLIPEFAGAPSHRPAKK